MTLLAGQGFWLKGMVSRPVASPLGRDQSETSPWLNWRGQDSALMAGVAQRDSESFMRLYDRYASLCYGLACRLFGEGKTAEAAVEDVFLLLWRQAPTMEPSRNNLRIWLLTRICRRAHRGRGADQAIPTHVDVSRLALDNREQ